MSARLRLTASYVGLVLAASLLMLAVVWVFLLRYVPARAMLHGDEFFPGQRDLLRAFVPPAMWALAVMLLIGSVGGWILAGKMLAPLARVTAVTRRVADGELTARIALEDGAEEFRELAAAFDAMLEELEQHVASQERFAANASHELRTPLAITQAMLDVARREPPEDASELVERLWGVNVRAIELIESLLLLSRSEHRLFEREDVDLSLLVEEAIETQLPRAESRGIAIETELDAAVVEGSETLLLQLVSNLVLNAIVHNAAEGGWISIALASVGDRVRLSVENTGSTVPAELIPTLTEPFQRGAQRARGDDSGAGLGLAIVSSVTRAHGGELTLDARPSGGLRVRVELPLFRGHHDTDDAPASRWASPPSA